MNVRKRKERKFLVSLLIIILLLSLVLPASKEVQATSKQLPEEPIQGFLVDKARYNPGEKVKMSLLFDSSLEWKGKLKLDVFHLNEKVAEGSKMVQVKNGFKGLEVEWTPSSEDFHGYLVTASIEGSDQQLTAAIDVSSDWTRYPRYGYTTEFPQETQAESNQKMKQLTQEYYLNGFQFYDWMWRHDVSVYSKVDENGKPILDENGNFITEEIDTNTSYDDLLGRGLHPLTIKQQIQAAQKYNAATMAYQMNYAARENYEDFGVNKEWGLYKKDADLSNLDPKLHQDGFYFDWVDPPTALYLQDPGNEEWQKYITREFNRSVNEFGFDGMHLDQWGWSDNDYLYDYHGQKRYFSKDYDSLINSVKDELTSNNKQRNFVTFNMVGGNAGYQDVPSPSTKTDFDYSEIWQDKDNYRDLLQVVEETRENNGGKAVVIAGYMNYKEATGDHYHVSDVTNVPKSEQFVSRLGKIPGWVGDFGKQDEDQIIWNIEVPESGTYELFLKYGHDNGESPEGKISINHEIVEGNIVFSEKTGWGNPVGVHSFSTHLNKGKNEVKLQLNTNNLWLNIDSLVVSNDKLEKEYEAEYAELISCKVDKYGHVYNFETDGDFIEFTVNVSEAGSYPISFNYGVEREAVSRSLYINQDLMTDSILFNPTGGWESFEQSEKVDVPLKAGENKVVLKVENVNDLGAKVDYLTIGDVRYEAEKATIGWDPSYQPIIQVNETSISNFNQQGDYLSFKVDSEQAHEKPLSIVYKNAGKDTERSIVVNGKKAGVITFPQAENWSKVELPIYLNNGTNDITIKMEKATTETGIEIDQFEVMNSTIEAEKGIIGWSPVVSKTSQVMVDPGKTDNHGNKGQQVIFKVNSSEQVDAIAFKYRSGNNPMANIYLDGELIAENTLFASTPGGWGGAMIEKSIKADVSPGEHEIVFELASNGQYLNVDSLVVNHEEYQVEDAQFAPVGHGISTTIGHVYDFKDEGDFLLFEVDAPKEGTYDLVWRYNNDSQSQRSATRSIYVNEVKVDEVSFHYNNKWEESTMSGIELKEGRNTVSINVENIDDDGVKLDYLQVANKKYHAETTNTTPPMHIYKDTLLNFGHVGDEVTFDMNLTEAGETSFIFTYSNEGSDTARTIYIDGKPILDDQGNPYVVGFKSTGSKDSYSEDGYVVLPSLPSGKHTVTLKQKDKQRGSINLRKMTVGYFDEPAVRLMDAGLAAMGATHIEIGTAETFEEGPNMLAHEYYPNRSKKMTNSLKESMKDYYKFFAAYENLLFDSVKSDAQIEVKNNGTSLKVSDQGEKNSIWAITRNNKNNKGFEDYEIIHLVNLLNNDENWRNAAVKPNQLKDLKITYQMGMTKDDLPNLKVYTASPDQREGKLQEIQYEWDKQQLVITLPSLEYWEMIVIDQDGPENQKIDKVKW